MRSHFSWFNSKFTPIFVKRAYFAGTEVYGGSQGVKLKYSTTTRFETLDSGVNITGNLRVNNAELASGASAGFAIAMAIAL